MISAAKSSSPGLIFTDAGARRPFLSFAILASVEDRLGFLPAPNLSLDALNGLSGDDRSRYVVASSYHTAFVMGLLCAGSLRDGCRPPLAAPLRARGRGAAAKLLELIGPAEPKAGLAGSRAGAAAGRPGCCGAAAPQYLPAPRGGSPRSRRHPFGAPGRPAVWPPRRPRPSASGGAPESLSHICIDPIGDRIGFAFRFGGRPLNTWGVSRASTGCARPPQRDNRTPLRSWRSRTGKFRGCVAGALPAPNLYRS